MTYRFLHDPATITTARRTPRPRLTRIGFSAAALAVATLLASCSKDDSTTSPTGSASENPVDQHTPRLILLLTVDQMRADYLARFAPLFEGGFAQLQRTGQVFTDAHQDHAVTTTSPGHATISTGTHPSTHGIINNNWFERKLGEEIYSVDDDQYGRSPLRLLVPTLGDRLKEHWQQSKVFAVGGKDRATILTAGRKGDGAYWYNAREGKFTTSSYYNPLLDEAADEAVDKDDALPEWLNAFHERRWLDQLFGKPWTPTYSAEDLQEAGVGGVEALDHGAFSRSLPSAFGGPAFVPGRRFYSSIYTSPWIDAYVGELAATIIESESLGKDEFPDLLAVNFSATDAVGHTFGPDSPELVDTLVRLDRTIGQLLNFVDQHVGLEHVVVVLTADHGAGQVPEVATIRGVDAERLGTEFSICLQRVGNELGERFGLQGTSWMPALLYFDRAILEEHSVDLDQIREALAESLASCPRVERVILPREFEDSANDPLLTLFERSYRYGRSADLFLHLAPNTLATSTTASHGTAHRYDSWVPMIFKIPGFPPQHIGGTTSVTDIAPTIASVINLPGESYDGLNRVPQLDGAEAEWQESDQ